jgi:hypothetical protein
MEMWINEGINKLNPINLWESLFVFHVQQDEFLTPVNSQKSNGCLGIIATKTFSNVTQYHDIIKKY